ncbi:TonB-dependent receptor plug domain-containing protein [Sphingosinicella sp. LY1275]|uniref:TonB-dependent receptor plug domain-containing protein n=1 Tax=Sphingosinicella sp. LY1275 TaxID=3095379 RepID=UPI002ADED583|nr:TonB-dependent receptor [Sphingosinicella sp. LY1275]MEA1013437.1 TonB-dependent receptor [Sphingosinicella sp. LY1275]
MNTFVLFLAATGPANADPSGAIIVTGAREPVAIGEAAVSASLFDRATLDSLALPATSDVLRLAPGVSVATTGPRGTQTQVRIRGAEASHTLLFVDGIRFNDPAAGNEARFELLSNDALARIELVRGPQSALWGSEALGGVIALETADPLHAQGASAIAEYGSHDSARVSGGVAARVGNVGLSGAAGWLRSDGIDSFGAGGELDGFETKTASLKAVFSPVADSEIGVVGHYIEGVSDYDGSDLVTFRRADTLDSTANRVRAVRGWARTTQGGWTLAFDGSWLDSANRNRLAGEPLNSTFGERFTAGGQLTRAVAGHRLTAAVEHESESFRARDQVYFGATDQRRSRALTAMVGQWRTEWNDRLVTDIAVRHDAFSAFADETTLRGSVLFRPAAGWTVHAGYGEGIAQPSFYDLHGFFPGSFVGNPALRPERSKGYEAGVRWESGRAALGVTAFSNRLENEIVDTFDPVTFLSGTANVDGKSRRRGVELEGEYRVAGLRLHANYTYLDAGEQRLAGTSQVREVRRPRHAANLMLDGSLGAFDLGAGVSYVGKRVDSDFDLFPAQRVTLGDYVLASLKLGYRITSAIEAYARLENALDADYQDVVGYATPGRTVYAGLRLHLGR